MKNGKFEFRDFRNLVIIAVALMITIISFVVIAAPATSSDRYVSVDYDIWDFLKYVVGIFIAIIAYLFRELVVAIKSLLKTVEGLKISFALGQQNGEQIKEDVCDMKKIIEKHADRIEKHESVIYEIEHRKN